ncbi:alpha/beta fold hydrolase [Streptomyces sp. NBC_01320]|uniref:alpha/beta fold hydrolase n=1 Tax=Streptomyces sp. NBC_01320 TaxID=2903824 RepID=UPI002E117B81|nr:hypothetical protein OG395_20290 [Streptomyces sp. NBC_01320]
MLRSPPSHGQDSLSRDGTLITYRGQGDGPPVILVGGALGTAATEAPLAALVAARFSVVTYDGRGRGSSGDGKPYAVEREVVAPETVARMRRALESMAHTLAYDDALLGDGSAPAERFVSVTARTTVVCGGFSTTPARLATRALADAIPRARHRTLTGQTREPAPLVIAPVLAELFAGDVHARQAS